MTRAMGQRVHRNKCKGIFQDLKGRRAFDLPPSLCYLKYEKDVDRPAP